MGDLVLIGLDGEMTGSGSPEEFQLIQIGVATLSGARWQSDIGHSQYNSSEEAMKVNGFTDERVKAGPPETVVDGWLNQFLAEHKVLEKRGIAVGWNVGSFDMPFVRRYLPQSAKRFSYRSLDLNSVCFTIGEATGRTWQSVKEEAKAAAVKTIGFEKWHDAGYDAMAAIRAWEHLRDMITRK